MPTFSARDSQAVRVSRPAPATRSVSARPAQTARNRPTATLASTRHGSNLDPFASPRQVRHNIRVVQHSGLTTTTAKRPKLTTTAKLSTQTKPKSATSNLSKTDDLKRRMRLRANQDFLTPITPLELSASRHTPSITKSSNATFTPHKPKTIRPHAPKHWLRRAFALFLLFVIIGGIAVYAWSNSIISTLTDGESSILDLLTISNVRLASDANNRTNVLIFGTSGYDMSGSEGDYIHDGAQLTDSIMLLSFNQDTKDLAMLSLPRDLYIGASCGIGKINEIYYCNNIDNTNETAGASALISIVERIIGIDIHYFIHLDWTALIQVVDGIGGITVTLDESVYDYSNTGTVIEAGVPTYLTGEQALGLARARYGTANGDFTRGTSQQKILIAIQDKILTDSISLTQALNLFNALGDNVRTDFSIDELYTIYNLSSELSLSNMRQLSLTDANSFYLTTTMLNNYSFVVPVAGTYNYADIQAYLLDALTNYLPEEPIEEEPLDENAENPDAEPAP